MIEQQPDYLSYLLRLWRTEGVGQAATWHASLEDPRSGESYHFASLEEAVGFVQGQMGLAGGIATHDPGGREKPP